MICFPFANMALVAEVTGQQILDVLEHGAMYYPGEYGSFIQASGTEYTIDEGIPSSVKLDATGTFLGVDGEYRVKNVLINGEPLDTSKTYTLASHDHYLKNGGEGFILAGKCNIIRDDVMSDSDLIAVYIRDNLGGVIPEKYSSLYGEGRIKIINSSAEASDNTDTDTDNAVINDTTEDMTDNTNVTTEGNPSTGVGITIIVPSVCLIAAAVSRKKR